MNKPRINLVSLGAIALVSAIVMATLAVGVHGAVTEGYACHDSGARYRGQATHPDSIAQGTGRGRGNQVLPSDLPDSNRRAEGQGSQSSEYLRAQTGDWAIYEATLA